MSAKWQSNCIPTATTSGNPRAAGSARQLDTVDRLVRAGFLKDLPASGEVAAYLFPPCGAKENEAHGSHQRVAFRPHEPVLPASPAYSRENKFVCQKCPDCLPARHDGSGEEHLQSRRIRHLLQRSPVVTSEACLWDSWLLDCIPLPNSRSAAVSPLRMYGVKSCLFLCRLGRCDHADGTRHTNWMPCFLRPCHACLLRAARVGDIHDAKRSGLG